MDLAVIRDILECHVCYEMMKVPVYCCETGHTICDACFKKVYQCPTCQGRYTGTRSFIAERLYSELARIDPGLNSQLSSQPAAAAAPVVQDQDIDEFRPIECPFEFDGCNKSTIDFFDYINHLRVSHHVAFGEGSSYTKRFTTKGLSLVRGGSSRMFIVKFEERNFLFTAHEENGEVRIWATFEGSADEMSQYKVKMALHIAESQPDEFIQDWCGNVHSIRTTELDVGNACMRLQSELISEQLPAFSPTTWDKWYITVNLSMRNGENSPGNAAANQAPVLPVQPPNTRPGPTSNHRFRDLLLPSFDSSDSDLEERVHQMLMSRSSLVAAAIRGRDVSSSDDDEDDTIRPRTVFFQNLPARTRTYLTANEESSPSPSPRSAPPARSTQVNLGRRPEPPSVLELQARGVSPAMADLFRPCPVMTRSGRPRPVRRADSPRPSPPPEPEPPRTRSPHPWNHSDFDFARTNARLNDALDEIWNTAPVTPSRGLSSASSRVSSASNDHTSSSSSSANNDPCTIV